NRSYSRSYSRSWRCHPSAPAAGTQRPDRDMHDVSPRFAALSRRRDVASPHRGFICDAAARKLAAFPYDPPAASRLRSQRAALCAEGANVQPIISVRNLDKTYASGFQALKNIDLDIRKGEIFALLGPNGAGKTTLISIICGIVNPSGGTVRA